MLAITLARLLGVSITREPPTVALTTGQIEKPSLADSAVTFGSGAPPRMPAVAVSSAYQLGASTDTRAPTCASRSSEPSTRE